MKKMTLMKLRSLWREPVLRNFNLINKSKIMRMNSFYTRKRVLSQRQIVLKSKEKEHLKPQGDPFYMRANDF